jgi:N6-L-threonylcarbamoyladenine synthase
MYVLGIETSCDETSASIVRDGREVLSNVVASSLALHKKYGGVIPEIAFRKQLETITQVTHAAIREAGIKLEDIGLISVTSGPGLLGSLIVGISFAKAMSFSLGISLLGVNHLYGHIYAAFLRPQIKIKLPFVALVVSGGHTSLFYVQDFDKIKILGQTQDDACGEAFDKVAKILELGYPGGPIIERLAKKGNPKKIRFGCSGTKKPLNFSFSGIKTAVLYTVNGKRPPAGEAGLTVNKKKDIAASFQESVIDTLIKKALLACREKKVKSLVIGGGVVANSRLREKFLNAFKEKGLCCYFPSQEFSLDNAAMVAGLGYRLFKKGQKSGLDLDID